ncbi:hypothetical protein [Spirochaeta cellobiosiphila]|uniref:hypothetical protein n=1 Tax=Spirochaeta cellobiosiphila TaxID=504483 RepID=UPI0004276F72|nr:hypothetical protein [Spirochaeta cellobiosiphila]
MNISTILLYALAFILLVLSFVKDRGKTYKGLKKGGKAFLKILPLVVPLFLIVGVLLTYITPTMIQSVMGKESGITGILIALVMGSVAFMPPFVTYPLGAELIDQGAGLSQVAALVTALMGVGVVYMQAETKFFGLASTLRRNALALFAAVIVAGVVGVIL